MGHEGHDHDESGHEHGVGHPGHGHDHDQDHPHGAHGHGDRCDDRDATQSLPRLAGVGKTLFLDAPSGLAGDMIVAALVDLGVPAMAIGDALATLAVTGFHVHFGTRVRSGIVATSFEVHVDSRSRPARTRACARCWTRPPSPTGCSARAHRTFLRLATAEAKVHRAPIDDVHFHEVGASTPSPMSSAAPRRSTTWAPRSSSPRCRWGAGSSPPRTARSLCPLRPPSSASPGSRPTTEASTSSSSPRRGPPLSAHTPPAPTAGPRSRPSRWAGAPAPQTFAIDRTCSVRCSAPTCRSSAPPGPTKAVTPPPRTRSSRPTSTTPRESSRRAGSSSSSPRARSTPGSHRSR